MTIGPRSINPFACPGAAQNSIRLDVGLIEEAEMFRLAGSVSRRPRRNLYCFYLYRRIFNNSNTLLVQALKPDQSSGRCIGLVQIISTILLIWMTPPVAIAAEKLTGRLVQKPNIVVIMTDDQDDTGSIGTMSTVQMSLAEAGVRFTNSFVNQSVCMQSRVSFLTGQSSHNHKAGGYDVFAARENDSLGVWLQTAGYKTALMGKFLNFYGQIDPSHVVAGWDEWHASVSEGGYFNYKLNENGTIVSYSSAASDYGPDVLTRKGVEFINAHAQTPEPFFLLLTPHAPHTAPGLPPAPIPAPRHVAAYDALNFIKSPNFNEPSTADKPGLVSTIPRLDANALEWHIYEFRRRREALLAVDDMVREILRALRSTDLDSRTYVIFTSDNGWSQGSHRWRGKSLHYEESMRVPLLIRGPGISINEVRTQLVTNLDLSATVLDLADARPTTVIDGRSLIPVLLNKTARWRSGFLYNGGYGLDAIPGDHQFIRAIRTERYLYSSLNSKQFRSEEEFYDLQVDPYEMSNRAGDRRCTNVVGFLRNALKGLTRCVGTGCWMTAEPPPSCN